MHSAIRNNNTHWKPGIRQLTYWFPWNVLPTPVAPPPAPAPDPNTLLDERRELIIRHNNYYVRLSTCTLGTVHDRLQKTYFGTETNVDALRDGGEPNKAFCPNIPVAEPETGLLSLNIGADVRWEV